MKTFIDLTFILNGTIGLICLILVLASIKSNRTVNIYLAIMIFGASFRFIVRGYFELTNQVELIADFSRSISYVFGFALPCLYFKHLIFPKKSFEYRSLLHFILPIALITENKFHPIEHLIEVELNGVITFLLIIQAIYYMIVVYLMLRKNVWKKTGQIEMETEQSLVIKRWVFVLFVTFTLMGARLIFTLLFMQEGGFITDNYFVWINAIAWFVVFMMILTSPTILNGYINKLNFERVVGAKPTSNWRLKPVNQITNMQDLQLSQKINVKLEDYFLQIDQFVEEEHFFRQTGLSVNDLALQLKMPKSHLSFIFKYHSEISFSDFKKVVRIKDSLTLIEEGYLKTNTFDSLSKNVGFSTYNTFFIAFKEVTSKAPQEFVTSSEL
jgi:AraC-like DNA-binding protein